MEGRLKQLNEAEGWQNLFKKSLLINWQLYQAQINAQGVYCSDDILLRITGTSWEKELLHTNSLQTVYLGKYFVLES